MSFRERIETSRLPGPIAITVLILAAVLPTSRAASVSPSNQSARAEMIVTDRDRQHWAYLPLNSPALPAIKDKNSARTPIDHFILARLEVNRLALTRQAEPGKLVRRIYFDLIGLPPTPEQVEQFVNAFKTKPQAAIESLVDQLLASPHYGERWAR